MRRKLFRGGLPQTGHPVTEGTANFVVNQRMNKSQQIPWSRSGAFHRQVVGTLTEWRPGYRILFASMLISTALAGCTVGPNFVAPSQPRATTYVMGQAATVSARASGDTTQQIYLGGMLDADWWTRLRSPELDRTVTLALSNNRTLEVARANILQASEEIKVARAGLLPQIDATDGLARQKYGASFLGPEAATFPAYSAYAVGVGVSYDLDVFGRTRRSIELAAADRDVQQEALRAAQLGVASDTVLEALLIASTQRCCSITLLVSSNSLVIIRR